MRYGRSTLLLALCATPLSAQESGNVIIVTAPGGTVDADETLAVDRNAIERGARADLFQALASEVPGVSLADAQGNPWSAAINWRGYSLSALQGTEQGMAVYLDGVRFNQPFGDTLTLDLVPEAALVRAEIREASPVYGRNALGGALLLQTATGRDLPGLQLSLSGDSFGGYGGSASFGTPDALVAVEALHDEGWRDFSPSDLLRGFCWVGADSERGGFDATLIGAETRLSGNGVAPVELLAADYDAIFTRPDTTSSRYGRATLAPYLRIGNGGRLTATGHYQMLDRRSANGDLADFGACDADPSHLCAGSGDAFGEPLRDAATLAPVAVDPEIDEYGVFNRGREQTSGGGLGVQLTDEHETASGTRRLALGVSWDSYSTNFDAGSELAQLLADRSVVGLGTNLVSAGGAITPVAVTTDLRNVSLYASADIPLARWLSVELGGRWSDYRVRLTDRIGTALNGTHRFRKFSPAAEFDFDGGDDLGFSVGYAETSRNPTPAELSCADPAAPCALANFFIADPPLEQVVARNWHAEARYASGPWSTHLGLWRSDTRNDIRHIASVIRGRAYFANLGATRRQGFDASIAWHGGPWQVGADYTLTDARFRSAFVISSPANPAADDDGLIAVRSGDVLPGTPRHALNGQLSYSGKGWSLRGQGRWRSGQYLAGDEGNSQPRTPSYAVFDLSGDIALTANLSLTLEARNIFDKRYATFGTFAEIDEIVLQEAPDASDPRAFAPGMPRRVSIAVKARF